MSAADRPFLNDASRLEKAEIHANERKLRQGERQGTTYHAQAMAGLDEPPPGGRFAQARYVTGSEPSTRYPAASSPWTAGNDAGLEPPTGIEIDAQEPCGEYGEVQASLAASSNPALSQRVRTASVEDDGAASKLARGQRELITSTRVAGSAHRVSSDERRDFSPGQPPEQPDDGLDVPRRADGFPMSSHAIKPRRKLK
jgi:hypothetical protein